MFINRIELYDDEIVVWFNYSDRTNPDNPDTDSRDFILQENYKMTGTSRFVIASFRGANLFACKCKFATMTECI